MPLPSYTPPTLRSARTPNPFDPHKAPRLRLLLDKPLTAGAVDGQDEFHGYPFIGAGSAGFPDAPAVLRSYLQHHALEVKLAADEIDDADLVDHPHAPEEADQMVAKHGVDATDALDGVMLYRVGSDLEADLIITCRQWLLAERGRPHGQLLANVVSPEQALAIIGLFLRWHQQPVIIGGAPLNWHPTSMRRSAAYTAMPAFERWNQAGRMCYDTTKDLSLENLNQALLTRVSRAFKFRDTIFVLSATMTAHEPEDMLCELDSLLFSLVGAFDVAARIADLVLQLNGGRRAGWQNTQNREWQPSLEPHAKDLFEQTKAGTETQHTFRVLRDLRNSIHNEALNLTRDDGAFYLTTETTTQGKLRDFLREGHTGWTTSTLGIKVQPSGGATQGKWLPGTGRYSVTVRRTGAPRPADPLDGTLALDVRQLVNKIFPASLTALNAIMKHLPLNKVPGHNANVDNPSRVNLPWRYSDTTGHRLRLLYGITELV